MIPKNIRVNHIFEAIKEIDRKGLPAGRNSKKFKLLYEGKVYPPKYVISLANKYANGYELAPNVFSGGQESNKFLNNLGFEILEVHKPANILKKPKVKIKIFLNGLRLNKSLCCIMISANCSKESASNMQEIRIIRHIYFMQI